MMISPTKIIETHDKSWITAGIKISCNHKRELYLLSRESNDSNLKNYCKQFCQILTGYQRSKNDCVVIKLLIPTVK